MNKLSIIYVAYVFAPVQKQTLKRSKSGSKFIHEQFLL